MSDADYRNGVFQNVVNRYNREELEQIGGLDLAYVAGLDFYHYRKNFWLHLHWKHTTKHDLINGDARYSYNNFIGGNWIDWSAGGVVDLIGKNLGIFTEVNLQQYWDRKISIVKQALILKYELYR